MGFSLSHLIVVAVIAILLFGRGRISELMGDVAKGIKSFKKGLADDDIDIHSQSKQSQQKITLQEQMTDITPQPNHSNASVDDKTLKS